MATPPTNDSNRRAAAAAKIISTVMLSLSLVSARSLSAQGVTATPDGQPVTVNPQSSGNSVYFTITNNESFAQNILVTCSYTGNVTSCSGPTYIQLESFSSGPVYITYAAGSAGSGTIRVTAEGVVDFDEGWYNVTIAAPPSGVAGVSPKGGSVSASQNTAGNSVVFNVQNIGAGHGTFSLSCARDNSRVTACSVSPSTTNLLAPGDTQQVTVTYSTGSHGLGWIELKANTSHVGWYDVAVTASTGTAPTVSLMPNANTIERDLCLRLALRFTSNVECGDLTITHALPSTTTFNRPRQPVLFYNSQLAHPVPHVYADVTVATVPDSVRAVLVVSGVERARKAWPGTQWAAGSTRRIAIGFDALNDSTGFYPYRLEVTSQPGNTRTTHGEIAIVNRSNSYFNAGWWLGGVERIYTQGGGIVWVGGDGSIRKYRAVGTGIWVAPSASRSDTIYSGSGYFRSLAGGRKVKFDGAGLHVATIPLDSQQQTTFQYTSGRLSTIGLPKPAGAASINYTLSYTSGKLNGIAAPGSRQTQVATVNGRIHSIKDPDMDSTAFSYDAGFSNRMKTRTDRRGSVSAFVFDGANKLSADTLRMAPDANIVNKFRSPESRTIAPFAVAPTAVYALYDGPRNVPDTTRFHFDRYGAPERIFSAYNDSTVLTRADGRFPALVTRIRHINGFVEQAAYTPRGNIARHTQVAPYGGGSQDAVTYYYYTNPAWPDFVTTVNLPEGDGPSIGYDANGHRIWQEDERGILSRVQFNYNAAGQVTSIVYPDGARDSLTYDLLRGNLSQERTPRGFLTTHFTDALGRDTLITTPIDSIAASATKQRHYIGYDVMGRVSWTKTVGPTLNGAPGDSIRVDNAYDDEGNLTLVTRTLPASAGINPLVTAWTYDKAGRSIRETAADGQRDSTVYDPAGNVTAVFTRRGHTITMVYDTLNRLRQRITPSFVIPQWNGFGIPSTINAGHNVPANFVKPYPMHGNGSGYLIKADTARFTYDAAGNLVSAHNRNARISRTYYPSGLLATDTLKIRTLAELNELGNFDHVYALKHFYDKNGRRTKLHQPVNLAPKLSGVIKDTTFYEYSFFGALQNVRDVLGNNYRHTYTYRSQLDSAYFPLGRKERYTYDLDGNVAGYTVRNSLGQLVRDITLRYDGRGRMVKSVAPYENMQTRYTGLGHLLTAWRRADGQTFGGAARRDITHETFMHDALGNLKDRSTRDTVLVGGGFYESGGEVRAQRYHASTGHLRASQVLGSSTDTTWYDLAGNVVFIYQTGASGTDVLTDRASFYDAEGRLHAADYRSYFGSGDESAPYQATFEEYRYDALGRRVLVYARRFCDRFPGLTGEFQKQDCNQSTIRRTVWDGEQELWEIQMPAYAGSAYLETDTVTVNLPNGPAYFWGWLDPNPFYGRVLYTHGLQLDHPLAVTRMGYVDKQYSTQQVLPPFTVIPGWNLVGDPDRQYVAGVNRCMIVFPNTGPSSPCAWVEDPMRWWAYGAPLRIMEHWHGTLLQNKADRAGTLYRRNRYYDAATGRFTQEDPIGLAGGLNLYGFADGDPVNFSDPFGLCPEPEKKNRTVCLALFIQSESVGGLRGDGRGFTARSNPSQSRVFLHIDVENQTFSATVNPTCRTSGECAAPLSTNQIGVTFADNGGFTVSVNAKNSILRRAPAINGSFTFTPDGRGGFTTSGNRDAFPSAEAYLWSGGQPAALFQRGERTRFHLFPIMPNDRWPR